MRADTLITIERQIVEWKRRAKNYEGRGLTVPKHVVDRIKALKADANLMKRETRKDGRC